jgi:hypothetical protein
LPEDAGCAHALGRRRFKEDGYAYSILLSLSIYDLTLIQYWFKISSMRQSFHVAAPKGNAAFAYTVYVQSAQQQSSTRGTIQSKPSFAASCDAFPLTWDMGHRRNPNVIYETLWKRDERQQESSTKRR